MSRTNATVPADYDFDADGWPEQPLDSLLRELIDSHGLDGARDYVADWFAAYVGELEGDVDE